ILRIRIPAEEESEESRIEIGKLIDMSLLSHILQTKNQFIWRHFHRFTDFDNLTTIQRSGIEFRYIQRDKLGDSTGKKIGLDDISFIIPIVSLRKRDISFFVILHILLSNGGELSIQSCLQLVDH